MQHDTWTPFALAAFSKNIAVRACAPYEWVDYIWALLAFVQEVPHDPSLEICEIHRQLNPELHFYQVLLPEGENAPRVGNT